MARSAVPQAPQGLRSKACLIPVRVTRELRRSVALFFLSKCDAGRESIETRLAVDYNGK
jgi:hypothetical protein